MPKEKRAAGAKFLNLLWENHLKTNKIYIFYSILGGPNDNLAPPFLVCWDLAAVKEWCPILCGIFLLTYTTDLIILSSAIQTALRIKIEQKIYTR